jgi:hypothetical protein
MDSDMIKFGYQHGYLKNFEIEMLAYEHHCHEIDVLTELGVRLSLHQLSRPFNYLNWCEHCRSKLLPIEKCIQSPDDFHIAVRILVEETASRSSAAPVLPLLMSVLRVQFLSEETIGTLLQFPEFTENIYEVHERLSLPKISLATYSSLYRPEWHELFYIEPDQLKWNQLYRFPNLIKETDETYWFKGGFAPLQTPIWVEGLRKNVVPPGVEGERSPPLWISIRIS